MSISTRCSPTGAEAVVDHQRDRGRGDAAPGHRTVDPVADRARPQHAVHDVRHVDLADEPAAVGDHERQHRAGPSRLAQRRAQRRPGAHGRCRSAQLIGEVGSHGSSHCSLRSRISLHAAPSRSRGGRSATGSGRPARPATRACARSHRRQRFESSSGITVTREPATTSVTSSSMTTRQFDEAIDAIRCEPGTADERHAVAAVRLAVQHAATVLPPAGRAVGRASSAIACTVARWSWRLPSSLRIAGRTNTSNDTSALTGLPGRQKIGTSLPEVAEALRLARLHRDLDELDRARARTAPA